MQCDCVLQLLICVEIDLAGRQQLKDSFSSILGIIVSLGSVLRSSCIQTLSSFEPDA